MAEERTNGHGGESRLDRIERALELLVDDHVMFREEHRLFREEHKLLLTAQVILTDRIDRLVESSKRADERMDALISVVDGIVRRPPPQAPPG
jgi:hypothetical protein